MKNNNRKGLLGVDRDKRQVRLRDLRVSKLTLLRYRDAVTAFCWFCHWHFGRYARDLEELDSMCCEFVESCWEECEARSVPSTTLAGVQHFLQRRRCLPRAWWLLNTWALFDMPARAPPIPSPLLFALIGKALSEGLYGQAAALALCFAGFLRTGEMLQMQFRHIALFPEGAVVALPLTKMGRRRGAAEMVTVDCPVALRLFMKARSQCHLDEKLVFSPDFFRRWWRASIAALELDPDVWRPYGLRRGGATEHFRRHGNLESTMFKGRWTCTSTARVYLVEAMSLLASAQIDLHSHISARLWVSYLRHFLQ